MKATLPLRYSYDLKVTENWIEAVTKSHDHQCLHTRSFQRLSQCRGLGGVVQTITTWISTEKNHTYLTALLTGRDGEIRGIIAGILFNAAGHSSRHPAIYLGLMDTILLLIARPKPTDLGIAFEGVFLANPRVDALSP